MKLYELTIQEAHRLLKQKEISSQELTRAVLDRIEAVDETIGAYITVAHETAMAQARRASEECIFMLMGKVVEHDDTGQMFVTPKHKETADYIEGRYG